MLGSRLSAGLSLSEETLWGVLLRSHWQEGKGWNTSRPESFQHSLCFHGGARRSIWGLILKSCLVLIMGRICVNLWSIFVALLAKKIQFQVLKLQCLLISNSERFKEKYEQIWFNSAPKRPLKTVEFPNIKLTSVVLSCPVWLWVSGTPFPQNRPVFKSPYILVLITALLIEKASLHKWLNEDFLDVVMNKCGRVV